MWLIYILVQVLVYSVGVLAQYFIGSCNSTVLAAESYLGSKALFYI